MIRATVKYIKEYKKLFGHIIGTKVYKQTTIWFLFVPIYRVTEEV